MVGIVAGDNIVPTRTADNLEFVTKVVKDTFLNKICSTHHVSCPCECGEPINRVARDLFEEPAAFDPLEVNKNRRIKGRIAGKNHSQPQNQFHKTG